VRPPARLGLPSVLLVVAATTAWAVPGSAAVATQQHLTAPAVARASPPCDTTADATASSLRPAGPPRVTPGSFMAKIRTRGYLIAGVSQSTYPFGFFNRHGARDREGDLR
jgi:polar amino acid transport system substrate-binding protein